MEFPIDPIRSPLLATGSKSRKSANLDCVSNATKSISKNIFILYEKEYIDEFFDETRFHVFIRLPYPLEISRYSSFHLGIDASSNFFFSFSKRRIRILPFLSSTSFSKYSCSRWSCKQKHGINRYFYSLRGPRFLWMQRKGKFGSNGGKCVIVRARRNAEAIRDSWRCIECGEYVAALPLG